MFGVDLLNKTNKKLKVNKLFSERNGLRDSKIKKTADIDTSSYCMLWDYCEKYKTNLAWKYPNYCPDNSNLICGINDDTFFLVVSKRIPDLYYGYPPESYPYDPFGGNRKKESRKLYSILDFVEFIAQGIKTVIKGKYHDYFSHYELSFIDDNKDFESFRAEINEAFDMCGLLYNLTEERIVERIVDDGFIIEESKTLIETVPEKELKKLIEESIKLHKSRNPDDCHLATEKIWDALERLKTIYIDEETDKKASATKVISQMANSDEDYINLFSTEFVYLTNVGNNYRIRHHEIGKKDIPDDGYYDYFFSRCFSLIMLALKYIK